MNVNLFCERNIAIIHDEISISNVYGKLSPCIVNSFPVEIKVLPRYYTMCFRNGFKYKKQLNIVILKSMESGLLNRFTSHYKSTRSKKDMKLSFFGEKNLYRVDIYGVRFEHIHLIIKYYFAYILTIPFLILFVEYFFHQFVVMKIRKA